MNPKAMKDKAKYDAKAKKKVEKPKKSRKK